MILNGCTPPLHANLAAASGNVPESHLNTSLLAQRQHGMPASGTHALSGAMAYPAIPSPLVPRIMERDDGHPQLADGMCRNSSAARVDDPSKHVVHSQATVPLNQHESSR